MVAEPRRATTAIHLVPRQVTLAMNASVLPEEKKKMKKANKEKAEERRMDLERIVALFLHKSGYRKTLDTFRSEVQLKDDDIKGNFDLEDLLRRLVEFCGCNLTSCNEKPLLLKKQEEKNSGVTEDVKLDTDSLVDKSETPACHDGETIVRSKLKKQKYKLVSDSDGGSSLGVTKDNLENIEKEIDRENLQTEASEDLKGKKKKKKAKPTSTSEKMMSQFVEEKSEDLKLHVPTKTGQLDEPTQKSKSKKKKPTSDFSAFDANQGSEAAPEAMKDAEHANINGVSENAGNDIVPEQKVRKKKLTNDIVERLDEGILTELREDNSGHENQAELSNTGSKFETDHTPKEELVNTKSKKSKKKRSTAEGESQSNEKHAAQASEKDTNCLILHQEKKHQSSDALCPSETDMKHTKKKRKTQGAQDDIETLDTNLGAPSGFLTKQEDNDSDGEKALNLKNCNGIHAKNEIDTPSSAKSKESYGKLSAEPRSVKAFQRVKVDDVKFADERLQDNSYWAKDGADIGYGAKAQEVLGQVKGRDFRHEKTKKKGGSYRGGQIDFNSHSIKFNYSDEE